MAVHGAPKCLYSDNEGEFNNTEVHYMAKNFSIEIKTTAAYIPWSNGLLERHNVGRAAKATGNNRHLLKFCTK